MIDEPDTQAYPATAGGRGLPDLARRRLALPLTAYGVTALACGALLIAAPRLPRMGAALRLRAIVEEAMRSGLAGVVLAALLLGFAGLAACAAMTAARIGVATGRRGRLRPAPLTPGRMARVGQGVLVPVLAGLAAAAGWAWRPAGWIELPLPADAYVIAGVLFALAFALLVGERAIAGWPATLLPEAPALRCLLLLPVLGAALGGVVALARGLGFASAAWIAGGIDVLLALVALELALRALGRWFLPPPPDDHATAAVDSLLAMLAAGIAPRPAGAAAPLRSHFGLDFSRSWALAYLRRAAVPAVVATALFCWLLSGVTLVPLDQRGIYESYGAPVAVFGPGLHVGLPWPLGRIRSVELGVVHAVALGGDGATVPPSLTDAEAMPGAADDRLWTGVHPAEADYLIASSGRRADGTPGQGFQVISADLRVLWRVGAAPADARAAAYAAAAPDALVRAEAGRVVARFFATRTLDALLAERRETMAAELRDTLAGQIAAARAGIEILAVVVEAVHPPAGAADAYHAVQAAEIASRTSVSTERGRAHGTSSLAHEAAHSQLDAAQASAAELAQSARADATRFGADTRAAHAAGRAFLIERYFADLAGALARAPLTLVDDRLGPQDAPVIDLRPPPALALPPAGPGDPD